MDAMTCLLVRRSIGRLVDPAPDEAQLEMLLRAAVAAPDHGQLRPWRFVVFRGDGRRDLGAVFAQAHAAREPDSDIGALEKTAAKPLRAPLIVAVICRPVTADQAWNGKHIPAWEQTAAVAAAAQNLCLAAHATGFGSMWRTGWYGEASEVRQALAMGEREQVVGWIYLGSVPDTATLVPRRPSPLADRVTTWR
ncbi:MAG TPA: nitroreductase [Euzebya sp.]|nr:nitroreductase [Euzebya sp.]